MLWVYGVAIGAIVFVFLLLNKPLVWKMQGKKYVKAIFLSKDGVRQKLLLREADGSIVFRDNKYPLRDDENIMLDVKGTPTCFVVEGKGALKVSELDNLQATGIEPRDLNSLVKFAIQNARMEERKPFGVDPSIIMLVAVAGIMLYLFFGGSGAEHHAAHTAAAAAKQGAQYVSPPVQYKANVTL